MFKVYLIYNTINDKCYIGQTSKTLHRRFSVHAQKCNANHKSLNTPIFKAIEEYGKENFFIKLLAECETRSEALRLELLYANELNTIIPNGYNCRAGSFSLKGRSKREYRLQNPDGELITFSNVANFAIENKFTTKCIYNLLSGHSKSHAGWTLSI